MSMVIKRYRFVDTNGYPAQRVEDSVKGSLYVAEADFDAQRLRADTAEADLKIAGEDAALMLKDLDAAEQRIAELEENLKASVAKTIDRAAKLVETRLNEYVGEHGFTDPDTGTMEFPGDGAEYVEELDCIASFIRALNPNPEAESHE